MIWELNKVSDLRSWEGPQTKDHKEPTALADQFLLHAKKEKKAK